MTGDSKESLAIREIEKLIVTRSLTPGMRLPSERELCNELGLSRGYVRAGLKRLEWMGLVTRLPRKGVFIRAYAGGTVRGILSETLRLDSVSLRSLLELRSFVEIESAGYAARRAPVAQVAAIESSLQRYIEASGSAERRAMIRENRDFHLAISRASCNEVLHCLLDLILPDVLRLTSSTFGIYAERRIEQVIAEHTAITEAIRSRDTQRARMCMEIHMQKSRSIAETLERMDGAGAQSSLSVEEGSSMP